MGHMRLGNLYKTKRWKQVISLLEGGAGGEEVAANAMLAAERGFRQAAQDSGFKYTVWLTTQITLAAKEKNFSEELKKLGMEVPKNPGLFDLVGAFTKQIDSYLAERRARTDISEMAQFAAVETLSKRAMERSTTLFGTTPEDVQRAVKELSTKKNFASFAREFFSQFACRYLNYFISREASKHVGPGGGIRNIDEHTAFNEALALHCRQSAAIVEEFAGGWYSKTAYETGITQDDAAGFASVALKKFASELKRGT